MSAIFYCIFPCCGKRASIDDEIPNESSRIIVPGDISTSIPSYNSTTIDHGKARERLNGIVKSKEGKMVRVLARVPFNLRNDSLNAISNASSSRSSSANMLYSQDHDTEYFNEQGVSRLSSRSASNSSILQASTSRFSNSDDMFDGTIEHKLKVQLVPSAKSKMRILGRRGRSKTRYGRPDDMEGQYVAGVLEGIQSVDSNRDTSDLLSELGKHDGNVEEAKEDAPETNNLSEQDLNTIQNLSSDVSKVIDAEFDDVGTLTRSWGE